MRKVIFAFAILSTIALFSSCRREPDLSDFPEVTYNRDIHPLMVANCTFQGCHASGAGNEFSLESYDDVISNGEVKAGKAYASELYKVVSNGGGEQMPPSPNPHLSNDQIKTIYVWIERGAKND